MSPPPPPTEPPIGGTRAQALLGVNAAQLNRLRQTGLLGEHDGLVAARTSGGHWRYDEIHVRALAARPWVDLPSPNADLAVHLSALRPDPEQRGGRTHLGWHVNPSTSPAGALPAGALDRAQREEAWAGWWTCRPEPHLGAALVGAVCGFVVEVARIDGFRTAEDGRVRFELAAPTRQMLTRYRGRRFRAAQGGAVQLLGRRSPDRGALHPPPPWQDTSSASATATTPDQGSLGHRAPGQASDSGPVPTSSPQPAGGTR